jgi:hypothetical protein
MPDIFRLFTTVPTVTTLSTVLTMSPDSTAILRGITICNALTASGDVACDVLISPSGGSDTFLFRAGVYGGDTAQPLQTPVVITPGSSLKVQVGQTGVINITGSYLESE